MHTLSNSATSDILRECEPELRAITRALEGAHLLIGIAGLILGVSAGSLLLIAGVGPFAANPVLTLVSSTVLGTAIGLWFGGASEPGRDAAGLAPRTRRRYHQYQ